MVQQCSFQKVWKMALLRHWYLTKDFELIFLSETFKILYCRNVVGTIFHSFRQIDFACRLQEKCMYLIYCFWIQVKTSRIDACQCCSNHKLKVGIFLGWFKKPIKKFRETRVEKFVTLGSMLRKLVFYSCNNITTTLIQISRLF